MNATIKNAVTILASRKDYGTYGHAYQSKLVRRGEDHYLIHDQWSCGNLGDEMYRPFLILVHPENVSETTDALNGPEAEWADFCRDTLPLFTVFGIITKSPRTRWALNV
jgi:hypothetical protein